MKKQYKTPLFEVLELVADESLCISGDSNIGNSGDNELDGDGIL